MQVLTKVSHRQTLGLVIASIAVTGGIIYYSLAQFGPIGRTVPSQPAQTLPEVRKITALGRLEPEAEIIKLSAPLTLDGDRVAQLFVEEGDRVTAGQVIAILDSRDRLQKALLEAQQQVSIAKAKLAQVQAGAKTGEIQAQQASIEGLQAKVNGDRVVQEAAIARIEAQLQGDRAAQQATIAKLEAESNNSRKPEPISRASMRLETRKFAKHKQPSPKLPKFAP